MLAIALWSGAINVLLGLDPKLVTCVRAARGIKGDAYAPDR